MDVVNNGSITGKSIAVQIKCGDSYISKKSQGGIKYEGINKHLNYYLNLNVPVILIVISGNCSKGFWAIFDIEKTSGSNSGWWIEIPVKNKLDITAKAAFEKISGDSKDFSEEIRNSWAMDQALNQTPLLAFAIPKSEVASGSLVTLTSMIKKLSKNKGMTLRKMASAEVFFPDYASDPRELYEIPEVRFWFLKSIKQGIPWFYFLEQKKGLGLSLLLFCTCNISFQYAYGNKHALKINPEELKSWLELNFSNLNKFTDLNDISDDISEIISGSISDWLMRISIKR